MVTNSQVLAPARIRIPFNKPFFAGNEQRYVAESIVNKHISGDGAFTKEVSGYLEREVGVVRALLTTNCTHALEMSAMLLNIRPGDEVIVPSFTFVSTANAFVLRGARPIFVDCRADTLNIDERLIEGAITERTRAIVVVHYAGVACEMDAIMATAAKHGIPVIEDNAHGLFASYRGRHLGTFGVMATQSFHETKNFTCGEGGALLINDPQYIEPAEIIREKGTNRSRFFRGQVDKYTWVSEGSSYLPSDMLAAFLKAQFEARDRIEQKREHIWKTYNTELAAWAAEQNVGLPHVPEWCEQSYHMYYLLMPSYEARTAFIAYLARLNINAVFHYLPLHRSEYALANGFADAQCPVTESVSDRLVRLPFYNDLDETDQHFVVEAVRSFTTQSMA